MANTEAKAVARVRVLLEVELGGSWGGACDLNQVWAQAKDEATGALRRGLYLNDGVPAADQPRAKRARILEMTPVAVLVEEPRG